MERAAPPRASPSILVRTDAGEAEALVEVGGGVDGVLAGHGVGDEENFAGVEELFEALHLAHQLFVDVQAAGGVDDERVAAHDAGFAAGFLGEALDQRGTGGLRLSGRLRRAWPRWIWRRL